MMVSIECLLILQETRYLLNIYVPECRNLYRHQRAMKNLHQTENIFSLNIASYTKNQNVSFNHYLDSASSEKATISIPEYTQDLISAFYYARTIDFVHAKEGDVFPINGYLDDEILPLNIKYLGKEKIKSKVGWINCIKFRPMLTEGRVFKEQEDMTVWVSDDKNRIPVRVQADVLVGSIKMDLVKYENLANELALVKK